MITDSAESNTEDTSQSSTNLFWQNQKVTRISRQQQDDNRSFTIWFTGLSGSGKTTLAHELEKHFHTKGIRSYVLDGDNLRHGLCSDLGFSVEDRTENLRRAREVAKLLVDAGIVCMAAFISPFEHDRTLTRQLFEADDFFEIHCDADLNICEQRDVKGLYRRARSGDVKDFTGISSPYEAPTAPDLRIATGNLDVEASVKIILSFLRERNVLNH